MNLDLHMHTTESDGEHYPKELVVLAKEAGLNVISITDHDSSRGVKDAIEEGKKLGVKVIPGIEFSASDPECRKTHILGYNIDYKNQEFIDIYSGIIEDIVKRNDKLVKTFNDEGINITMDELKNISKSINIRKPVFAKLLLQKGYISEIEQAYNDYFEKAPFKYVRKEKSELTPKEVISIIKRFGGTAVLAHPYSLGLKGNALVNKIDEFRSYGLEGLECFHSRQTQEEMETYEKIALERNMIITKGSDFHGAGVYKETKLGTGNDNNLKDISMNRLNRIYDIIG